MASKQSIEVDQRTLEIKVEMDQVVEKIKELNKELIELKELFKNKKWKGVYRLNCPMDDGTPKDERLKKGFKTFIHHIEESNKGYTWDWNEQALQGKHFGGVFGEKEYEIDGNNGFFTTMRYTCEVLNHIQHFEIALIQSNLYTLSIWQGKKRSY